MIAAKRRWRVPLTPPQPQDLLGWVVKITLITAPGAKLIRRMDDRCWTNRRTDETLLETGAKKRIMIGRQEGVMLSPKCNWIIHWLLGSCVFSDQPVGHMLTAQSIIHTYVQIQLDKPASKLKTHTNQKTDKKPRKKKIGEKELNKQFVYDCFKLALTLVCEFWPLMSFWNRFVRYR